MGLPPNRGLCEASGWGDSACASSSWLLGWPTFQAALAKPSLDYTTDTPPLAPAPKGYQQSVPTGGSRQAERTPPALVTALPLTCCLQRGPFQGDRPPMLAWVQ